MATRNHNFEGFTLLELSLVILLMAIMLGFTMPRFSNLLDSTLHQETYKIARLLEEIRLQAILEGRNFKIVIDTKKSQYSIMMAESTNPNLYTPFPKYGNPISLPEPIEIYNISQEISDTEQSRFAIEKIEFDKIFGQTYEFEIDSSGFMDRFTLKLKDKQNKIALSVVNIMGKVVVGEELPL